MNHPRREGESLEDYGKRLIIEMVKEGANQPPPTPKPPFIWPEEFDDEPVELTQLLRAMLNANDREKAKELVNAWYRMAIRGHRTALREMLDRIEGPSMIFIAEKEEA